MRGGRLELLRQDVVNILIEHAGDAQGDPLARRRQERTLPGKSLDDDALKMSMQGEVLFHEHISVQSSLDRFHQLAV